MHKIILIALLSMLSGHAMADWEEIDDSDTQTTYANLATIVKTGNIVQMWNMFDLRTADTTSDGKPYMSMKLRNEYNCDDEQVRTLAFTFHSKNMGKGKVVASGSNPSDWKDIEPDTINALLLNAACEDAN